MIWNFRKQGIHFTVREHYMNPLEITHLAELCNAVTGLIKIELGVSRYVTSVADQVVVSLSRFEVENRLGNVLQQIYRTIDLHIPIRQENLS